MAVVTTKTRMTEDEFMRLPDDGHKYELVDGEAKEVPTGVKHDEITAHLCFLFYPSAKGRGALCGSQAGFRMRGGNLRAPDVSFTLKERLPGGKAPTGFGDFAPDLCIEILSPSEEPAEIQRKLQEYFESGAKQVWQLAPETQTVRLHTSPTEKRELGSDDEIDGGDLLPGFHCHVRELFEVSSE